MLVTTNDTDAAAPASTVPGAVIEVTTRSGRGWALIRIGLVEVAWPVPLLAPS